MMFRNSPGPVGQGSFDNMDFINDSIPGRIDSGGFPDGALSDSAIV
jgi:hypothetical protein